VARSVTVALACSLALTACGPRFDQETLEATNGSLRPARSSLPATAPLPGSPTVGALAAPAGAEERDARAVAPDGAGAAAGAGAGSAAGTGSGAANPGAATVRAWASYVNSRGGLGGHRVRVIIADDGNDPARAQALVRQLVEKE
jgi:branched-chain amino acid transport system substrate-binding protein